MIDEHEVYKFFSFPYTDKQKLQELFESEGMRIYGTFVIFKHREDNTRNMYIWGFTNHLNIFDAIEIELLAQEVPLEEMASIENNEDYEKLYPD
jgi:hypothetical protein